MRTKLNMGTNWMTNLPEAQKTLPLTRLAIPGSHNSGAYDLTTELAPYVPAAIQYLCEIRIIHQILKRIILNVSECQKLSIGQQLEKGIRHFDLRVATKVGSNDFYLVHSLYGSRVKDAMEQIRDFLDNHPGEAVILDFQHFYEMQPQHHQSLIASLKSIFGSKLCPKTIAMKDLTLKNLQDNKKQVICIYQDSASESENDLWSSDCIHSPWPNTSSPQTCIDKLTQYMNQAGECNDQFFVCQGVLTPNTTYVAKHVLFFGSIYRLAEQFRPIFFAWLEKSRTKWKHKPNIVIQDFVEEENYIQQVIDLNKYRVDSKMLLYNRQDLGIVSTTGLRRVPHTEVANGGQLRSKSKQSNEIGRGLVYLHTLNPNYSFLCISHTFIKYLFFCMFVYTFSIFYF